MEWVGISGSGRGLTTAIEDEVRGAVRAIVGQGNGIVTGGVLGVDYVATETALEVDPSGVHIKVCLPADLETYLAHVRARQDVTVAEADRLEAQLRDLQSRSPASIVGAEAVTLVDKAAYNARNDTVIRLSDRLCAFQINKSPGTQYTIDRARAKGIPIDLHEYTT